MKKHSNMYLKVCAVALVLFLSACSEPAPKISGYVEGEYVLMAPLESAEIIKVHVRRGDTVERGQTIVSLDTRDAEINLARSKASLQKLKAELNDLMVGKRSEEIAAMQATEKSLNAQVEEAKRTLQREERLLNAGQDSRANFDKASTELAVKEAELEQLKANLALAKLPARNDKISAALAAVEEQQQAVSLAQLRLNQREITAPSAGTVFDVIRREGELAGPQAPVLSLLPDNAVLAKLYVPQNKLSSFTVGGDISLTCDGCDDIKNATVTYISDSPEFTPQVIYSTESRQKLVYLIEARPNTAASSLTPGQIVSYSEAKN
ncbi:HlyD family secretion protein [Glaciecola siphonariae]|uniref:HlyD family secretion protein n=1 Tax=Glaciecola siphonariae TaxID=521012 RepID=A0ABV9LQD4_9ALTE